jgi:transcriptional regulator with XRE-family HTH domain
MNDPFTFCRRLREAREKLGRSKAEMARFLGFSPQRYQRYEDGRIPDAGTIMAISEHLGVTADWLLGIDPSSAIGGMKEGEPAKPGSSDLAVRDAERRRFVYPDADDPKLCPGPADCDFDARLRAIEGAQARMEAQLSTLTQLLGATLAAPSRNGAAPESERKAG